MGDCFSANWRSVTYFFLATSVVFLAHLWSVLGQTRRQIRQGMQNNKLAMIQTAEPIEKGDCHRLTFLYCICSLVFDSAAVKSGLQHPQSEVFEKWSLEKKFACSEMQIRDQVLRLIQYFGILDPHDPLSDKFYVVQNHRSTYFEALEFWNVSSCSRCYTVVQHQAAFDGKWVRFS